MTTVQMCDLCIGEGHAAALVAVGRCWECKRGFCDSHRARDYNTRYTDWCKGCQAAKASREKAKVVAERAQREEEIRRIRECMETLGERGLVPRKREVHGWKKKRFGKGYRPGAYETRIEPDEPAWPIGDVKWDYLYGDGPPH